VIQIAMVGGPYAGQVRTPRDLLPGMTPVQLLCDCALMGWAWRIVWPPQPLAAQAWAQDWLTVVLAELRLAYGLDITGRVSVTAQSPPAEEIAQWVRADLIGRIFLAAVQGRAIRFGGRRWVLPDPRDPSGREDFYRQVEDLEDALSTSGRWLGVLTDGHEGDLVIGMAGPEDTPPEL
jgi:hypothetical protein